MSHADSLLAQSHMVLFCITGELNPVSQESALILINSPLFYPMLCFITSWFSTLRIQSHKGYPAPQVCNGSVLQGLWHRVLFFPQQVQHLTGQVMSWLNSIDLVDKWGTSFTMRPVCGLLQQRPLHCPQAREGTLVFPRKDCAISASQRVREEESF